MELTPEEQGEALGAFARALRRESNVLGRRPEIAWQQLVNRLQWAGESAGSIAEAEQRSRLSAEAEPWLALRTPVQESPALRQVLEGHTNLIAGCAFSPDGKLLVSASCDGTLRLWDARTAVPISVLTGHTHASYSVSKNPFAGLQGAVQAFAFSPDGTLLASAGDDGTLRLWDVRTGGPLSVMQAHSAPVWDCAFSPGGAVLASAGGDGTLRLWDERGGTGIDGHRGAVLACAFSPDGALLVSGGADGTLRVWDAPTGAAGPILKGHAGATRDSVFIKGYIGGVPGLAFTPDGSRLASAGGDGTLRLWDARTGAPGPILEGHIGEVMCCAFSPDGALLASGGGDGKLRLWDARTGAPGPILQGHTGAITCCAFSPDGTLVVSGGRDERLLLWDTRAGTSGPASDGRTGVSRRVLGRHEDWVSGCAFSPDGTLLVSASRDRTLRLWDAATHAREALLEGHKGPIKVCAFSPDGTMLASGDSDGTVRLWEVRRPGRGRVFNDHRRAVRDFIRGYGTAVNGCAFSPNAGVLASAGGDGTLRLWNTRTGTRGPVLDGSSSAEDCAFSPDGAMLASAHFGVLRLWHARTGNPGPVLSALTGDARWVRCCAFSPDGAVLASGGGDGAVRLWDAQTGTPGLVLEGHAGTASKGMMGGIVGGVWGCAFSPDGALLASVGADHTVRLWNARTGNPVIVLELPAPIVCVALAPDRPVAVCGDRAGVLHWVEFSGILYGPLIVTAVDEADGPHLRCPACGTAHLLDPNWLGRVVNCPGCRRELCVNPFVVAQPWTSTFRSRLPRLLRR